MTLTTIVLLMCCKDKRKKYGVQAFAILFVIILGVASSGTLGDFVHQSALQMCQAPDQCRATIFNTSEAEEYTQWALRYPVQVVVSPGLISVVQDHFVDFNFAKQIMHLKDVATTIYFVIYGVGVAGGIAAQFLLVVHRCWQRRYQLLEQQQETEVLGLSTGS